MFLILGAFYLLDHSAPHSAGAAYGVIDIWRLQRRMSFILPVSRHNAINLNGNIERKSFLTQPWILRAGGA